jgi:hypothetical protein
MQNVVEQVYRYLIQIKNNLLQANYLLYEPLTSILRYFLTPTVYLVLLILTAPYNMVRVDFNKVRKKFCVNEP